MPDIRPDRQRRQRRGHILPAADPGVFEKFVRESIDVFGETAQVVILRIGCLHDFVQGLDSHPRLAADAFKPAQVKVVSPAPWPMSLSCETWVNMLPMWSCMSWEMRSRSFSTACCICKRCKRRL